MGLFANLCPAKNIDQHIETSTIKYEAVEEVDLTVVREITRDVYFGTPKEIEINTGGERMGCNNMIYSESEIKRIARAATDGCLKRKCRLVSIDKANMLNISQLCREAVTNVCTD